VSVYPQHEKLQEVAEQSQMCGEFIEWLAQEKGIHLAEWVKYEGFRDERLTTTFTPLSHLLAEFFDIDPDELEREKRAMLEAIRG
jgi:hypothetical protein